MIISHKHKFIFIKCKKTAGTSIETYLSPICGRDDVFTSVGSEKATQQHNERNYKGLFNPFAGANNLRQLKKNFIYLGAQYLAPYKISRHHAKFYNHIPARIVRARVPKKIWDNYYKFCVERNYLDKSVSSYYYEKKRYKRRHNKNLTVEKYIDKGNFCFNYQRYTDTNDNVIVDYICNYKNLDDELSYVFDKLDVPFDGSLDIYAKSKKRKHRGAPENFFTGEQIKILKSAFAKERRILKDWRENYV